MATGIEERFQVLGIALPDPPSPGGNYDSPKIINGASYLLVEIFDDAGRPLRAAVGVLRTSEERISGSSSGS